MGRSKRYAREASLPGLLGGKAPLWKRPALPCAVTLPPQMLLGTTWEAVG